MTIELYLIPIVHVNGGNVPKYLPTRFDPNNVELGLEGLTHKWAWVTYLLEDAGLLITDVTAGEDAQLSGHTDVTKIPPLDNAIPNNGVRNTVRQSLEDVMIPGLWVQTGMTYRSIMRVVLNIFSFHNRFVALIQGRVFDGSLNLDMTVADIPQAKRNLLQQTADDFGLDYSGVTGSTTIRQLLLGMASQFADVPYRIAGSGLELII